MSGQHNHFDLTARIQDSFVQTSPPPHIAWIFCFDDSFAHYSQTHEVVIWNGFPTVLKEFPEVQSTWLLCVHFVVQLIPNNLNLVQVRWSWNQKSQIWTHWPTGLMSIYCVSWPKHLLFYLSRGFFAAKQPQNPDWCSVFWTVDVEMCLLLEHCEELMWGLIWDAVNLQCLSLVTRMNLFSVAEVNRGLRVLGVTHES